jgi:hypothetical protein
MNNQHICIDNLKGVEPTSAQDIDKVIFVKDYILKSSDAGEKRTYTGYIKNTVPFGNGTVTITTGYRRDTYTKDDWISEVVNGPCEYTTKDILYGFDEAKMNVLFRDGKLYGKFSGIAEIFETKTLYPMSGEYIDGKYHGIIINIEDFNDHLYATTVEYKNGIKDGPFKYINIKNQHSFSGTYVNDKIVGDTIFEGDNQYFSGPLSTQEFVHDATFTGKCIWKNNNTGSTYVGDMVNCEFHGIGSRYHAPDNTIYDGNFVSDLPSGKGVLTFNDKFPYEKAFTALFNDENIYPVIYESDGFIDNNKFTGVALVTIKGQVFKFIANEKGVVTNITKMSLTKAKPINPLLASDGFVMLDVN